MSDNKHRVTRRQFLNYTLTGVGGFMAAGMLMPMLRFAFDPLLKDEAGTDMVAVADVKEITTEPKRFDFKVKVKDAWYESEEPKSAWVYKTDKGRSSPCRRSANTLAVRSTGTRTKSIRTSFSVHATMGAMKRTARTFRGRRRKLRLTVTSTK
ncbi:hypothetical protein LR69_00901 [Geobacillus sp. BCO2]|nr:hypothetical protein LR69_00901 [Geobacillus sp. BCO2]